MHLFDVQDTVSYTANATCSNANGTEQDPLVTFHCGDGYVFKTRASNASLASVVTGIEAKKLCCSARVRHDGAIFAQLSL